MANHKKIVTEIPIKQAFNWHDDPTIVADLPSQRMRALVPGQDCGMYAATDSGKIWLLENAGDR